MGDTADLALSTSRFMNVDVGKLAITFACLLGKLVLSHPYVIAIYCALPRRSTVLYGLLPRACGLDAVLRNPSGTEEKCSGNPLKRCGHPHLVSKAILETAVKTTNPQTLIGYKRGVLTHR
jgi:hypothetical protein